jgi:hypothetical protein
MHDVLSLVMCDHLHDTTSRYDAARKLLTCLLVCRICGTEKVVETLEYEPRPTCTPAKWRHPKLAA